MCYPFPQDFTIQLKKTFEKSENCAISFNTVPVVGYSQAVVWPLQEEGSARRAIGKDSVKEVQFKLNLQRWIVSVLNKW